MQEYSASQEEKNISGCAVGCITTAVLVPLILIVGAYLLVMHSSVPLRMVAGLVDQANGVTISGVGGSISNGFTIDELRIADDDGQESVMEGLVLKWKDINKLRKSNDLIIEEISLDRAHFFFDSDESSGDNDEDSDPEDDDPAGDPSNGDGDGFDLRIFELRKVDIREVVFESKNSDFKVEIDKIFLKGLRIEDDDFTLEDLSVGSNFVDIQLEDATAVEIDGVSVPFTRRIRGVLKSNIHPSVLKDIDLTIDLGAKSGGMVSRVQAFNGTVDVFNNNSGGEGFMITNQFSAAEYFSPDLVALPDDLSVTIRSREDAQTGQPSIDVEGGTFRIGVAEFVIAPQVLLKEDAPIPATSSHGDLEISATLRIVEEGVDVRVDLESQPARQPRELMSALLFEKPYNELDAAGKEQVDASVKRFHFRKAGDLEVEPEAVPATEE